MKVFFTILFIVVNGMVNFDVSSHLDNHLQKSLGTITTERIIFKV